MQEMLNTLYLSCKLIIHIRLLKMLIQTYGTMEPTPLPCISNGPFVNFRICLEKRCFNGFPLVPNTLAQICQFTKSISNNPLSDFLSVSTPFGLNQLTYRVSERLSSFVSEPLNIPCWCLGSPLWPFSCLGFSLLSMEGLSHI